LEEFLLALWLRGYYNYISQLSTFVTNTCTNQLKKRTVCRGSVSEVSPPGLLALLPLDLWQDRTSWWKGMVEEAAHLMAVRKQKEIKMRLPRKRKAPTQRLRC
jgi:hypothetical protein